MDIVYLDQNKWIELARVYSGAVRSGPLAEVYFQLLAAVEAGRALFPLSASHVLETSKRNDPESRGHVAATQAVLSKGFAYRSRASRLQVEICSVMHQIFGNPPMNLPEHWFLAECFLEAFESLDSLISQSEEVQRISRILTVISPADLYTDYMTGQSDEVRRMAHASLKQGLSDLVGRMEMRRKRLTGERVDLRRRAYFVQLFMDHEELFIRIADHLGYSYERLKSIGASAVKALVEEVPTLNVEAEMSARLEAEAGALTTNDVLDMQSFYTAIPYSSRVIAEKASVSRARQAKLDVRYQVVLSHSLTDLLNLYSKPPT
ncbi:hypothetical protein HUT27_12920 [Pseudomonas chlororaphis]|uniref:hypothetical protein n=1 Tax=Pseudomonas chlororaphis TaxID=587753 RepID=UPI001B30F890|nr:hypothetical protein [Pseudomonas chlororaphis]MBP5064992.1 hypothetical protein [Pseudomonas chlororaphis]QTT94353.1 hypothetical protein HUT27_12920 [Pseudomonas chlororaphis]